jgi:hypothetical protein
MLMVLNDFLNLSKFSTVETTAILQPYWIKPILSHFVISFNMNMIIILPIPKEPTEIRTIQALLGQPDVSTSMICTHALQQGGHGVASPLNDLDY